VIAQMRAQEASATGDEYAHNETPLRFDT
jgi:hypothetical protein